MLRPRILDTTVLGQVYNAGSLPTTTGKFYAVHPVSLSGLDGSSQVPAEGGTLGYSVDTSTTLLFHVIGSTAPSVGEILIGHYAGNEIYVAERMHVSTSGFVSGSMCIDCRTGSVWPAVLNLSWSCPSVVTGVWGYPSTDTLTYTPNASVPSWAYGNLSFGSAGTSSTMAWWIGAAVFSSFGSNYQYVLLCTSLGTGLYVVNNTPGNSGFLLCSFATVANCYVVRQCSPFLFQSANNNISIIPGTGCTGQICGGTDRAVVTLS